MTATAAQQYVVVPLSIQKEGDFYLVGNSDLGDFYHFPPEAVKILGLLKAGETAGAIRSRLAADNEEPLDVEEFVEHLTSIGFIHPEHQKDHLAQRHILAKAQDRRRTFNVDPRIAQALFSPTAWLCYGALVLYVMASAIRHPELRVDFSAFYIETNRTPLLILLLALSILQTMIHESGHMLAACRYGIKCKYGIGTRLWTIVAESDLTGILTLPRQQRYLPMLAGMLADIVSIAVVTILIQCLQHYGASDFTIHVMRAFVLEIVVGLPWQFNIFVKTDIYYVICNYIGHPDLDRDARIYLRDLLHRMSFGRFGQASAATPVRQLPILRTFALIWLIGRIMSLLVLLGVFMPTMLQYILSAVSLFAGPPAAFWGACDTAVYVALTMSMLLTGLYMWLRNIQREPH